MSTPQPTLVNPVPVPRSSRFRGVWLLVIVLVAQTWAATRLWPDLGSILDPRSPVVIVDHAIHEYHGALGAKFLSESGTTWGYDPFFMAGYPETPLWDSSSNLAIGFNVVNALTGARPSFRPYKVGLFAVSILGVLALAIGARMAGGSWVESGIAAGLAAVYFWVGYPNALWRSGLFAFLTAAIAAPLLLGLLVRFDLRPGRVGWIVLGLAGAGLFFTHVTAPILVGAGAVAFYALVARKHDRRWHWAILGAVGLTVALNLIWLVPLWRFRGLRIGSGSFLTSNSARFLIDYYLTTLVIPQAAQIQVATLLDARTGLIFFVLGLMGMAGWWFTGRRAAVAAFGGSILALILLTGFGSLWEPTKILEPLRFRVAFCYLLAVPAASCLVRGSTALARRLGGRWLGRGVTLAVWVLILGAWIRLDPIYLRGVGTVLAQRRPLVVGYPREAAPLVASLRHETDLSARVLFEDQLRLLENTDAESTHWTPLLPSLLAPDDRLFIGGLYHSAFIQHHQRAAFGDFYLGGRAIDEWTPAEFAQYADQYNLGWVVCWSPLARYAFDQMPGATRVATLPRHATYGRPPAGNEREWTSILRRAGPTTARKYVGEGESSYALYRLDRPHSYFVRGKGRLVSVAPNRVELADVEPDAEGVAVLSLHWIDTWKTDPAVLISPEPTLADPVPFVRIESKRAIPRLVIENGGGWW